MMTQQQSTLYVRNVHGRVFLVVGWKEWTSGRLVPIVAPVDHKGPVKPLEDPDKAQYSAVPFGGDR